MGHVAPRLRPADLEEIAAAGSDPVSALSSGLDSGGVCLTGLSPETGEPALMFGVAQSPVGIVGHIWLLGTPVIEKHPTVFLRESRKWLEAFHSEWPVLTNAVYAKNTLHTRWLEWLGFTLVRPVPHDPRFIEFVRFQCVNPLPSQR